MLLLNSSYNHTYYLVILLLFRKSRDTMEFVLFINRGIYFTKGCSLQWVKQFISHNLTRDVKLWCRTSNLASNTTFWTLDGLIFNLLALHCSLASSSDYWWESKDLYSHIIGRIWILANLIWNQFSSSFKVIHNLIGIMW